MRDLESAVVSRGVAFFGAAAASSGVTWNPGDTATKVTLSGANLVASRLGDTTQSFASVRATTGKTAGKWYFEVVIGAGGVPLYTLIGVAKSSAALTNFVGSDANGWGYYADTGQKYTNNVVASFGASYVNGDVLGIALDMTAGKVWFAKNNTWQASGNPAAGTGEAFSGIAGTIFPMASLYNGNRATDSATGRFKTSAFSYTPPAGFSAWE